ncbi:MAG TPA: hypothetical protein VM029_23310 [Opitutaceae bacterium]|nr:hypothetical protein [Opitutaceae bacterium]
MKSTLPLLMLALGAFGFGAGCRLPAKGSIYDRNSTGRSMNVETGSVTAVRGVQVSGRTTVIGVGGGGLMGRAAASGGSGVGGAVVQAASTIGGAVIGEAVEEAATRKNAQEITIKLATGDSIVVVQEIATEGNFRVGENVQVLRGSGDTIVRRLY